MIHSIDPQQPGLFDSYRTLLSNAAYKRIRNGWQGEFRHAILELMPVDALSEHFNPVIGRRTKELYSMAGLVFVMEFRNWAEEEAMDAYLFDNGVGYALNLPVYERSVSTRTLERYLRYFHDDELAAGAMATRGRGTKPSERDLCPGERGATDYGRAVSIGGGTRRQLGEAHDGAVGRQWYTTFSTTGRYVLQ